MLRKITAYLHILAAIMIILAHAVIPHHHHQLLICIESEHCATDALPNHHDSPEHEHDTSNNPNFCFLTDIVSVQSNNAPRIFNCQSADKNHFHEYPLNITYLLTGISISQQHVKIFNPDLIPLYSSILSSSSGLRAPPTENVHS